MYLREQHKDINRETERDCFNKSEKREGERERNQASICREGVRRHAFWQELKKTAVFGVVFLNASMLLQSPRLAWPIFSQGWPLFYFCHLWATQLLIHMQMKLAPSLACITASARCSVHSYGFPGNSALHFSLLRRFADKRKSYRLERGEQIRKKRRWTCHPLLTLC